MAFIPQADHHRWDHSPKLDDGRSVAVVVIAGGASRRFGADKALWIPPGSHQTNTARLAALGQPSVVVRGSHLPPVSDLDGSTQISEDPPGSGPAMAAHAGIKLLSPSPTMSPRVDEPDFVLLVACDLLGFGQRHLEHGLTVLCRPDNRDLDAAVFRIEQQPHWLASLWRWRGGQTFADVAPHAPARALYAERRWGIVEAPGVADQNRPPGS